MESIFDTYLIVDRFNKIAAEKDLIRSIQNTEIYFKFYKNGVKDGSFIFQYALESILPYYNILKSAEFLLEKFPTHKERYYLIKLKTEKFIN